MKNPSRRLNQSVDFNHFGVAVAFHDFTFQVPINKTWLVQWCLIASTASLTAAGGTVELFRAQPDANGNLDISTREQSWGFPQGVTPGGAGALPGGDQPRSFLPALVFDSGDFLTFRFTCGLFLAPSLTTIRIQGWEIDYPHQNPAPYVPDSAALPA